MSLDSFTMTRAAIRSRSTTVSREGHDRYEPLETTPGHRVQRETPAGRMGATLPADSGFRPADLLGGIRMDRQPKNTPPGKRAGPGFHGVPAAGSELDQEVSKFLAAMNRRKTVSTQSTFPFAAQPDTLPRPLERTVLYSVKKRLQVFGITLWRRNVGGLRNQQGKYVAFSARNRADLEGIGPGGRRWEIEVKRYGEKPTRGQLLWLKQMTDLGAVAFWVDNADTADRIAPVIIQGGRIVWRAGCNFDVEMEPVDEVPGPCRETAPRILQSSFEYITEM
jgi:hypothetical protein